MPKPLKSLSICHAIQVFVTVMLLQFTSVGARGQGVVENVVLVTLDGLRPEELFTGGDRRLMVEQNGVDDPEKLKSLFWRDDPKERRELLLPFLWSECNTGNAWIAGDVENNSRVLVKNTRYFSYPGYNEILTGAPDLRIDSNDKKYNENLTVLEWLHGKAEFENRIAAYCSWDVFPFIVNDKRSGIPVNAGWQPLTVGNPDRIAALNFVAEQLFHEWDGVRYDSFTISGAIEELKTNKPRVLFVSLGETDDWAHAGRYDRYLITARQNDFFIRSLWELTQELPAYREKTLFLVTTDHGRGYGREGWKSHGKDLPGSERIWVAAFGAGLAKHGIDRDGEFEQGQIAATIAKALGHDFTKVSNEIRQPLPILAD
ncbi:MAG: hypothetical protein AAFV88_00360 [Planctomycetota bacterium]